MKKPKVPSFSESHPIYQEVYDHFMANHKATGVIATEYSNQAYCASCDWSGSYASFATNQFACPVCGAPMASNIYSYHRDYGNTLLINEVNGIAVFSFIEFTFDIGSSGAKLNASETYRIYTDGTEYEICKRSGNSFKRYDRAEMDYSIAFQQKDLYEYHNYDADMQQNQFIKLIDILHTPRPMNEIFSEIANLAAKSSVVATCPVFAKPLPDNKVLLNSIDEAHISAHSHTSASNIAKTATQYDFWCGKCGKYHSKIEPINKHSSVSMVCDCGTRMSSSRTNPIIECSSFIIDVEEHTNCTVLRYCEFGVLSAVPTNRLPMPRTDMKVTRTAKINRIYYVVCYDDGTVALFDEDQKPIPQIEDASFAKHCVNKDIYTVLEGDPHIAKTGFLDYANNENDLSMYYFFGYMKTQNAQELVACGLHSLIRNLAEQHSNVPAYILKNNGKLTRNTFSDEQIQEFTSSCVRVEDFVSFMQIFNKDNSARYSDYMLLLRVSNKNNIADIYRKIPNAKFVDIMNYLVYLNGEEAIPIAEAIPLWDLYLNRASALKMDMENRDIAFPKYLKYAQDLLVREMSLSLFSEDERKDLAETARKITHVVESETHIAYVCRTYEEYCKHKARLLSNSMPFGRRNPDMFTMVIVNKENNRTEYMVDILGTFAGDKLTQASLHQILAFGNARVFQYGKLIVKSPMLHEVLKVFNIE